jgi:hypothetical protein
MRYKTLEEVAGKYGLTVDLDEKAQLTEWESRLKKLLETKQKELPNAKNPSLRHKLERECAEVQDAFKFVSQQNVFTRLRRCVDDDKQEIFEHELKKPECQSILPSENDPEYEQFLELKVAARKKWSGNPVPAAVNPVIPITLSPSNLDGQKAATAPPVPLASMGGIPQIAQPSLSTVEPGRGATGPTTLPFAPTDPSRAASVSSTETEPLTLATRNGEALDSDLSKRDEATLQAAAESAVPSVTLATVTGASAEKLSELSATTLSEPAAITPATTAQVVSEQQTETITSHSDAGRPRHRMPIKREHVSAALDVLVKVRALTGLGGSFTALKVVATALAVFLIALAGLITQFTRERSRQNERADTTQPAVTHEESRVIPSGSPASQPSKQPSEIAQPSAESSTAPSESNKPSSETPKSLSGSTNSSAELAKKHSDDPKDSSEIGKQPSQLASQPSDPLKQSADVAKQSTEATEPQKPTSASLPEPRTAPVSETSLSNVQGPNVRSPNGEAANLPSEPQKQASDLTKQSTEPPKRSSDVPGQSIEPPKQPSNVSLSPSQIVKQVSELAKQISEVAKAPVETSTPVPVAKSQESPRPDPPPETKTAPPSKPKIQLALLRIESTPPDASITIRGTKQPLKTPAEFNLMPGDYDIALALDCFTPVSTTLHLDGGENRVLTRQLQSLQPALAVRTLPPGAKIFVDGNLRNQLTPATITGIDAGDRWVTVELPGYRSQNMAVKAKCGETVPVDFGILERPTARVSITSNARGSSVWIDGSDSGQTIPCSMDLPLGAHRVKLVGPQGYRPDEKSFYLQDEDSVRLDVPLTPELVAIPANNPSPARPEPPREYVPRANPKLLVWCGLDYSMVKMIGTSRDFPESEIFPNSDRRGDRAQPMTSAWNELFMKEMYPRLSRDLGAIVQSDLHAVESRNARVTSQQIVHDDGSPRYVGNMAELGNFFDPSRFLHRGNSGNKNLASHINDADIAAAIRSYRLQTRSGLGLVFIMDRLVKRQETSCMYVVFFDIASRTIISQERVCTEAGGGGIRNHWFGSIKETVKRLPEMYHDAKLRR